MVNISFYDCILLRISGRVTLFPLPNACETFIPPIIIIIIININILLQNLYDNVDGLLDSFAAYWQEVAKALSHHPNLIGYEIMNEPWAGKVFDNPSLLIPGVADRVNIQKMNDKVGKAIREVDKKSLILFEGVTWDNFFTGFTDVPGMYTFCISIE